MNVDWLGLATIAVGGDAAAAFLLKVGVSGQLVMDLNGNIGAILSLEAGGGTPSVGAVWTLAMTNAERIFDLSGIGFSCGGSVSVAGASGGVEFISGTAKDGTNVTGGMVVWGYSAVPPLWAEGHGQFTASTVVSLNWIGEDLKKEAIDIMDKAFNSLPIDVQEALLNSIVPTNKKGLTKNKITFTGGVKIESAPI